MKKDTSHVVHDLKTKEYVCRHCGETYPAPKEPQSFGMFLGVVNAFLKEHRNCKKPK